MDTILLALLFGLVAIVGGAALAISAALRRLEAKREDQRHHDSLVEANVKGLTNTVGERVSGMSQRFDAGMTAVGSSLEEIRGLVHQLQKERAEQYGQINARLTETKDSYQQLQRTTSSLNEALAGNHSRGQWGERMAEDVLRAAGMQKGINYETQVALKIRGKTADFMFKLPEGKKLYMDVKFPAANYLKYQKAETDTDRDTLCQKFLKDVKDRVKEVVKYAAADGALPWAVMFIPNETVFGFIQAKAPKLLDEAGQQNVVMCSPVTLLPLLGVIRHAMDTVWLEERAGLILECLDSLDHEWGAYCKKLDTAAVQLRDCHKNFQELSGVDRIGLDGRLQDVRNAATRSTNRDAPESDQTPATRFDAAGGIGAADRPNGTQGSPQPSPAHTQTAAPVASHGTENGAAIRTEAPDGSAGWIAEEADLSA